MYIYIYIYIYIYTGLKANQPTGYKHSPTTPRTGSKFYSSHPIGKLLKFNSLKHMLVIICMPDCVCVAQR